MLEFVHDVFSLWTLFRLGLDFDRLQTQLFGKVLFLTVYAIILAFLFLPADCMENSDGLSTKLQATYVITEEELRPTVKSRRIAIQKMNRMQQSLMEQIVAYKQEVFCADLALTLCNMSFEMYYDPPGNAHPSSNRMFSFVWAIPCTQQLQEWSPRLDSGTRLGLQRL